jgi:hypothetical protein
MWAFLRSAQQWMAGTSWIRRLGEAFFRNGARRRTATLDHLSVSRCQQRALSGLVHQAQATRFGKAHDFRRIRTPQDFRRLVPLRTPAQLWVEFSLPAFPDLAGMTWPGPLTSLAALPASSEMEIPYLPLSSALVQAHREALGTALGQVAQTRPNALRTPWLLSEPEPANQLLPSPYPLPPTGGEGRVRGGELPNGSKNGIFGVRSWEEVLRSQMAALLQVPSGPLRKRSIAEETEALTRHPLRSQITCLAGPADQLGQVLAQVQQETGGQQLVDIWPDLTAVVSLRSQPRTGLRPTLGPEGVLWLEAYFPPEGPVALEDPRHGLLRLLPDHKVYFEFVPVSELNAVQPSRHGAAEVEPGVPYALALSSPAGLWACLTGAHLCFERRDPPLLRLLETDGVAEQPLSEPVPHSAPHPFPPQRPHSRNIPTPAGRRQNAGNPAGPEGRSGHSPW